MTHPSDDNRPVRPPSGGRSGTGRGARDGAGAGLDRPSPFERLVALLAAGSAAGSASDSAGEAAGDSALADLVPGLRRLGAPSGLDRLFRAALVAAIRRGPAADQEGWGPRRLLEVAGSAAEAGALPASTAPALRALLERLEERLHGDGLWRPETPLWWRPLPPPRTPERVWTALGATLRPRGAGGALPEAEDLVAALSAPSGPGWSVLPEAFAPDLVATIHGELEALGRGGVLELVRGGVGSENRESAARSDRVAYVTGLEPELLAAAPSVATLAQWLLHGLAERIAADLPGALHAPMSAMLTRYAAPGRGFAPHLDNPGGEQDNARALAVVTYLNAPGAPCAGGELSLWGPGRPGAGGAPETVPTAGGTMALFDARRVVHQVLPLRPGPDRWAMVVWLSDAARPVPIVPDAPEPTPAEVLEPLAGEVPVPEGTVLVTRLEPVPSPVASGGAPAVGPRAATRAVRPARTEARAGIVCTTSRVGRRLEGWCRHHLDLGFDHLLVVLDEATPPGGEEAARRLAGRLSGRLAPPDRLTVWSSREAAERRASVEGEAALAEAAGRGPATDAVAARQALHATAALAAARRGELGADRSGRPLDWLLHLDDDELFLLEGAARGGASLAEHLAALEELRREGPDDWSAVRYPNHELLLTRGAHGPVRFKCNPRIAAQRLGPIGWRRLIGALAMEQEGPRPYFRAYWNGKSAVAVEKGRAAAGVHGWRLDDGDEGGESGATGSGPLLLGPSILHLHLPTAASFLAKYRAVASTGTATEEGRLFPPSPLEERAVALVRRLEGLGGANREEAIAAGLETLYREELCLDGAAAEMLDAAGLLLSVDLDLTPWTDGAE